MSDPIKAAENAIDKLPDYITAKIEEIENRAKRNKYIFIFIAILLLNVCALTYYFMHREQLSLSARIAKDDAIMKNMQDSVKARDARIILIGKDTQKQDVIIAQSRDSINRAYVIIKQLQLSRITQIKKHEKDSTAINSLDLSGKLRLITGQH